MRIIFWIWVLFCSVSLQGQQDLLQSGPMLGYNEMREVLLWVQTQKSVEVQFAYWENDRPKNRMYTKTIITEEQKAFTAKLLADQVLPGRGYTYQLLLNKKPIPLPYPTRFSTQPNWQESDDDPPAFTLALGSCTNVNDTVFERLNPKHSQRYQIFQSIAQHQPEIMIWLGDNVYLKHTDWYTQTGIFHRYTHTRSISEMQALLASTHHYAIWDDHDFGPNDSDRSFIHKEKTLKAFELFWGNPTTGLPGIPGAISFFQYLDMDFFLLDNRFHRSPNKRRSGEKTILGKAQLEWLIDALCYSQAPFKLIAIGGQVLNTAPLFENYANHHFEERQYLLQRIEEENITGVVFLSGDRHHTELSHYVNNNGNSVYDLTISPLTSKSYDASDEPNQLRVPGTHVGIQNFGTMTFTGPRSNRKILVKVMDTKGKLLWEYEIK